MKTDIDLTSKKVFSKKRRIRTIFGKKPNLAWVRDSTVSVHSDHILYEYPLFNNLGFRFWGSLNNPFLFGNYDERRSALLTLNDFHGESGDYKLKFCLDCGKKLNPIIDFESCHSNLNSYYYINVALCKQCFRRYSFKLFEEYPDKYSSWNLTDL